MYSSGIWDLPVALFGTARYTFCCPVAWSVVLALGLCEADCVDDGVPPLDIAGYGEPMPCEGINRDDAGFRP